MSQNWAEALLFICVIAQFFCVTASLTSASRMLFAFSRDGAVPGHRLWRRVGKNRVPQLAVIAIDPVGRDHDPGDLELPRRLPGRHGIAVIGLYVAFILPVILRYRLGDKFEHGAWSLGNHYKWIDPLAIVWVAFISILFSSAALQVERLLGGRVHVGGGELRPDPVGGALLLFGGWYVLSAHKWFKGPVRMGTRRSSSSSSSGSRTRPACGRTPRPSTGAAHRRGALRKAPPLSCPGTTVRSIARWSRRTRPGRGARRPCRRSRRAPMRPSGRPQRFGDSLLPAHARRLDDRVDSLPRHVGLHPARADCVHLHLLRRPREASGRARAGCLRGAVRRVPGTAILARIEAITTTSRRSGPGAR